MFLTIGVVLSHVVLVLITLLLWGCFLALGLRLTGTRFDQWQDIFFASVISLAWSVFVVLAFRFFLPQNDEAVLFEELLRVGILLLGILFVIHLKFQTSVISTVVAWLPTNLSVVLVLLFGMFVWCPFVFETYIVPTSSMAPTLIGPSYQGRCPVCNATCKCAAWPNTRPPNSRPEPMICENFHISSHSDISGKVYGGDRFVAAKFLSPRRWDLLVFQHPENPKQVWVKRLVGLPGETIHIQNGIVHANGTPIPRPEHLAEIKYEPIPNFPAHAHATPQDPAQLADDEFFVLGDFSASALDSRYWQHGSPGHNPYAVPMANVIGVATHRFWPLDRMKVLWK